VNEAHPPGQPPVQAPGTPPEPPEPPRSQDEVVAHVLAELRRRFDVVARAARRAESSEGPAGDAVRAVRDAFRGMRGTPRD